MFRLYQPDDTTEIEFYAKTASTAYAFGDVVYLSTGTGYLLKSTTTSAPNLGLIYKTIASTDSDYAQNTRVPVLVPGKNATFLADVGTGTGGQTYVGSFVDLATAESINLTADTYGVVQVVGFISTTQMLVKFAVKGGAAAG